MKAFQAWALLSNQYEQYDINIRGRYNNCPIAFDHIGICEALDNLYDNNQINDRTRDAMRDVIKTDLAAIRGWRAPAGWKFFCSTLTAYDRYVRSTYCALMSNI